MPRRSLMTLVHLERGVDRREDFLVDATEDDLLSRWDGLQYETQRTSPGRLLVRLSRKDWDAMLSICEWWADERRNASPPELPERRR